MPIPEGYKQLDSGMLTKDSDATGPYLYNSDGNISQGLPKKIFTDSDLEFARIRVDVSQTSFFRGTAFRAFKRLNIAAAGRETWKLTVGVNTILQMFQVEMKSGDLDLSTRIGMTETTPFTTPLATIFRTNNMSSIASPAYVRQNDALLGGVATAGTGTEISVLLNKVSGNTQQASTVGHEQDDSRGVAPGVYYLDFTNLSATDPIVGMFSIQWEERP